MTTPTLSSLERDEALCREARLGTHYHKREESFAAWRAFSDENEARG